MFNPGFVHELFGEILLLIFVLGLFCQIVDMKAESVIGSFFDVAKAAVVGVVKMVLAFFSLLLKLGTLILKRIVVGKM